MENIVFINSRIAILDKSKCEIKPSFADPVNVVFYEIAFMGG